MGSERTSGLITHHVILGPSYTDSALQVFFFTVFCIYSQYVQQLQVLADVAVVMADLQGHSLFKVDMYINLTASNNQLTILYTTQHLHMQRELW